MENGLVLTRERVRRIDELAQAEYGLAGLVLMENAGSGAARIIDEEYGPCGLACIACGTGNNGGDGLVIARHLHNAGWTVSVLVVGNPASMTADCAANDRVIRAMGIKPAAIEHVADIGESLDDIGPNTVIVDALLGTGFRGEVRSPMSEVIHRLNDSRKRAMVAVDVPSGLDCDTGEPCSATIRADLTITFVALKPGLMNAAGRSYAGKCRVVGIGAPLELITRVAKEST